jgi:hypothetical protein
MSNVLRFRKPIACREAIAAMRALPASLSEIRNAQAQVKEDIRITVLMLDLAVAQARGIAYTTLDLELRNDIIVRLAPIKDLLEIARQKAIAL